MSAASEACWWTADKGRVNGPLFTYVRKVDRIQFEIYDRFRKLEALYDTTPRPGMRIHRTRTRHEGRMHENVVASNADTISAQIATSEIRPALDTDDGDWSVQQRARELERYAEGVGKQLDVNRKCRHAFKAGAVMKGTAVMKVWADIFDRPRAEPVMIDDIVVDEIETRYGDPRQLHHRTARDKDELKAEFPEAAKQIDSAQGFGTWATWAGWRPIQRNEIMVIESWRLPIGSKGHPRYRPGRRTITIDGTDLLDEEYHLETFPFSIMRWSRPTNGWYGIGMAERISGIQLALNRRNLQMERKLDHGAFPTTWVGQQDTQLAMQQATVAQNALGTVAVYRGPRPPETVTPPIVSPEELNDAERLSNKASQVSGVSLMASRAQKPAGVETGVALREYHDQTTERFAEQEKDYEQFVVDVYWLLIGVCKQLGANAPTIARKTGFGTRKIAWADVDMGEVRVWISAAATISRTRAGRLQTVVEWAQAGIISQDDAKRLMDHPDLDRAMSLYNAAIESVENCIEQIERGKTVMPEPFMNLKLMVWRAQQEYLNWLAAGAPEEILENLRSLIVTAAWMAAGGNAAANGNAVGPDQSMAGAGAPGPAPAPGMPGVPMPGGGMPPGMPPLPGAPPMGPAPAAAFSSQAMQLLPTASAG